MAKQVEVKVLELAQRNDPVWMNGMLLSRMSDNALPSQVIDRIPPVTLHPVYIEVDNRVVRADDLTAVRAADTVLGIASKEWELIPIEPIAEALNALIDHMTFTAIGYYRGTALFTFKIDAEIAGEAFRGYLIVEHSFKPGRAWGIFVTPVRVACYNTLIFAKSRADINIRIPHTKGAFEKALVQTIEMRFTNMFEQDRKILEAFAKKPLADDVWQTTLNTLWPTNTEVRSEKHKQLRAIANDLLVQFNDEYPRLAGTLYAGYNAITELVDWRNNNKSEFSALYGPRSHEKVVAAQVLMAHA